MRTTNMSRIARKITVPLVLAALVAVGHSLAQQSEDTKKSLAAQADRAGVIAERGEKLHYTRKFDLNGLPHYAPKKQLTGWIRLHGSNYLADGKLGQYWQQGFAKFQPGVRISYYLPTSAIAFAGLYYQQADLVMGHRPTFYDLLAYQRVLSCDPVEITAVTGSFDVAGWENSVVILVHKDNPLKGNPMGQLAGGFWRAGEG